MDSDFDFPDFVILLRHTVHSETILFSFSLSIFEALRLVIVRYIQQA